MVKREWIVETPMHGIQTGYVEASSRKEAEEKIKAIKYDGVDFNITWSGVTRIVGKGIKIEREEKG